MGRYPIFTYLVFSTLTRTAWAGAGSYAVQMRDHLGHLTEVVVSIVSDFTPPAIAAVNLPDSPSLQFDVTWDAADEDSGIQS